MGERSRVDKLTRTGLPLRTGKQDAGRITTSGEMRSNFAKPRYSTTIGANRPSRTSPTNLAKSCAHPLGRNGLACVELIALGLFSHGGPLPPVVLGRTPLKIHECRDNLPVKAEALDDALELALNSFRGPSTVAARRPPIDLRKISYRGHSTTASRPSDSTVRF